MIWYAMTGTWAFYALGALYVVAPVIAWLLATLGLVRLVAHLADGRPLGALGVSASVALWFVGMAAMLVALLVGHVAQGLWLGTIVKSSIGWAKGWALLALFPFIGCLAVRPAILVRAACVVGAHTLLITPLLIAAWALGLPQTPYVSPLQAVGGPGPEFFAMTLYEIDPGSGTPRFRFFTPWAPAAGFVGNVYFLFALAEPDRRWKALGLGGALAMILLSQSRLALVVLASVPLAVWGLSRIGRPVMLYLGGVACALLGAVAAPLMALGERAAVAFREARADSSRVRSALGRIAVDRWRSEAPIWGHGVVERGPHLVEYMPIGSHHTWFGLLFVKGVVGFGALALPLLASFAALLVRAPRSSEARIGLGVVLVLFLYTFGENLEVVAYLVWPGLVFLGLGTRPRPSPVRHDAGATP